MAEGDFLWGLRYRKQRGVGKRELPSRHDQLRRRAFANGGGAWAGVAIPTPSNCRSAPMPAAAKLAWATAIFFWRALMRSAATEAESTDTSHTPRLSIAHLMLWALCSSGFFALIRIENLDAPFSHDATELVLRLFYGVADGALMTGAMVLAYSRFRFGAPLLSHPGHWMLLIGAILTVPAALLDTSIAIPFWICAVLESVAYCFAVRFTKPIHWRVLFGTLATLRMLEVVAYETASRAPFLSDLALFAHDVSWALQNWGFFLSLSMAVVVLIFDLLARDRRDWLHWTGIVTYVGTMSVTMIWGRVPPMVS
jgi:hypothetical protein